MRKTLESYQRSVISYQRVFSRQLSAISLHLSDKNSLTSDSEASLTADDSRKGFTLIEILVSVGILGVVFATIILTTSGLNRRGRDTRRVQDLRQIQSAIQNYYADHQYYPDSTFNNLYLANGTDFTVNGRSYLMPTPKDPDVGSTTPYCYIPTVAINPATPCIDAVNSTTKCQFYRLCANLEDPDSTAIPCTCSPSGAPINYNYSITSP